MSNFHPPEVVGRGSGTQLQVGENFNYLFKLFRVNPYNAGLFLYKPWRPRVLINSKSS